MKKFLIIWVLSFFIYSCNNKTDVISIYVSSDFYRFLWGENEKYFHILKKFRLENSKNSLFIDLGGAFSQKTLENFHSNGKVASQMLFALNYNAVVLDESSLDINSKNMAINLDLLDGRATSTNIYWKKGKTPENLSRYIIFSLKNLKFGIISAIIKDYDKLDKRFYTVDYKIENPAYEINRNISKIYKNVDNIILIIDMLDSTKKDNIVSKLEKIFSVLTIKPDIFIIRVENDVKPFKFKGKCIIPINIKDNVFYKIDLSLSSRSKIKSASVKTFEVKNLNLPYEKFNDIEDVVKLKKNVENFFNKKISYSSQDILIEKSDTSPLGDLIAQAIKNYIKCHIALYDYSLLKSDIKKGSITVKDIYKIFENDDYLIYVKMKGRDIENMLNMLSDRKISFSGVRVETLKDGNKKIYISNNLLKDDFLYRVIIPQSLLKSDNRILTLATEFSVLPRKTVDAAIWYFKTHKI